MEPAVTSAMVRETAKDIAKVIDAMPNATPALLPGFQVFLLDGNHLPGTEHRVKVTRTTRQAALPGQTRFGAIGGLARMRGAFSLNYSATQNVPFVDFTEAG